MNTNVTSDSVRTILETHIDLDNSDKDRTAYNIDISSVYYDLCNMFHTLDKETQIVATKIIIENIIVKFGTDKNDTFGDAYDSTNNVNDLIGIVENDLDIYLGSSSIMYDVIGAVNIMEKSIDTLIMSYENLYEIIYMKYKLTGSFTPYKWTTKDNTNATLVIYRSYIDLLKIL